MRRAILVMTAALVPRGRTLRLIAWVTPAGLVGPGRMAWFGFTTSICRVDGVLRQALGLSFAPLRELTGR